MKEKTDELSLWEVCSNSVLITPLFKSASIRFMFTTVFTVCLTFFNCTLQRYKEY